MNILSNCKLHSSKETLFHLLSFSCLVCVFILLEKCVGRSLMKVHTRRIKHFPIDRERLELWLRATTRLLVTVCSSLAKGMYVLYNIENYFSLSLYILHFELPEFVILQH